MVVIVFGREILVKLEQNEKAPLPILVTELGIVIFDKLEQP